MPRWGWWTLLGVLATGCGLSIAAWRYSLHTEHEANRIRFERRVDDAAGALQQRLDDAVRLLRSSAALFAASREVGRADWKAFADQQNLEESFPGLLGLGHAMLVGPQDLPRLHTAVHLEGLPDYQVWPAGGRTLYAPVLYREPTNTSNQRALGFDLLTDPVRREAMHKARDSGQPALSAPTHVVGEGDSARHSTSVLFLPIYQRHRPVMTLEQRRAAVQGWVYTPVHLRGLMALLVRQRAADMVVELWDGPLDAPPTTRLYQANDEIAAAIPRFSPTHRAERAVDIGGRRWTLRMASLPTFDASQPSGGAQLILAGGIAITLLMTALVGTLLNMRGRAVSLADRLSAAYRASEARVRTVLDNAAEGILTVDGAGRLITANPTARMMLGLPTGPLDALTLKQVLPVDTDTLRHHAERAANQTGTRLWRTEVKLGELTLLMSASEVTLDDGLRCLVLLLSDVSELERARALAHEAGALNEAILANAPFCVIATDRMGLIRSVNPAGERLLGYGPGELIGRDGVHSVLLAEDLARHAARVSAEVGKQVTATELMGLMARRGECNELECTYVRKDGTHVPVVLALAPLLDANRHVSGYVGIAYDITERKRSEAYIRHMAHHDELTGLPNRTLLQERAALAIEAARSAGKQLAVMLIDLDRFKQINDSLGHHAGDVVLCAVAARLKHALRTSDTVARMGGDEFVILLPNLDSTAQAERVAAKLLHAMVEPVQAGNHKLTVTPSIGIACFPSDGDDLTTLLRNADVAMYNAKNAGRNNYTVYTPQMHSASAQRLALEGDLRGALDRNELQLHYQPLVSLADGEIVGVEALLRWTHPTRGPVSPVDFIPIAEDTGLIVPIGEWVLRTACVDMKQLQRRTGRLLKVAVNLSPRQLRANNLTNVIADALSRAGWAAEQLELEITESMVVENPDASVAAMQRLRAMGVGLSIDDFGTGYSSLSYLTRFPVAKLKIDRSFVRGLPHNERDAAIARSVVAMGHGLKLQVLAEGIETAEQMQFLQQLGCDFGQGWHFAKPMPLEALVQRLQATPAAQPAPATVS